MKKLVLLSTVLGCLFSTQSFSMDIKPYAELKLANNFSKVETKDEGYNEKFKDSSVFGASVAGGVKLDQFRIELEGFYNEKSQDDWDVVFGLKLPIETETKGLFLNGYYDFDLKTPSKIKPYLGAGIGYSWLKQTLDVSSWGLGKESAKDKDISWNVGLGVGYELKENLDLTLGYRYENLGKIKDQGMTSEVINNKVSLGLRYTF